MCYIIFQPNKISKEWHQCLQCQTYFQTQSDLESHAIKDHRKLYSQFDPIPKKICGPKKVQCKFCSKSLTNSAIKRHSENCENKTNIQNEKPDDGSAMTR